MLGIARSGCLSPQHVLSRVISVQAARPSIMSSYAQVTCCCFHSCLHARYGMGATVSLILSRTRRWHGWWPLQQRLHSCWDSGCGASLSWNDKCNHQAMQLPSPVSQWAVRGNGRPRSHQCFRLQHATPQVLLQARAAVGDSSPVSPCQLANSSRRMCNKKKVPSGHWVFKFSTDHGQRHALQHVWLIQRWEHNKRR